MPLYEYKCKMEHSFELQVPLSEYDGMKTIKCFTDGCPELAERQISTNHARHFIAGDNSASTNRRYKGN